ncbi:MAG: glutamate--tRNA ligase family protein [bacterium]|nr:glutamate--tRNA ligase family protein [bacterium]
MSTVISRFAPSPTGLLHAGNYRTAVFAYLFAKHEGGKFIVRIEDTDAVRSKTEYETPIFETLAWLNLPADAQYRQSEHRPRHRKLLEKLIADNTAYVSKETPQAPGDREEVIRFKNPGGAVTFTDVIRGEITTEVDDLKDFIIARSLDEPVFHFAVAVDDADEGVTHVIRGADHISNTARQILILRALDFPVPLYAHLPLIFDNTHKKLSKRTGAKALIEYRNEGILPEAMLNYIAFLGWNPGDDREYLSRDELVKAFDISRVQKGSAIFDEVKLFSVNQHWMRELSDSDFLAHVLDVRRPTSDVGRLTSENTTLAKAVPLLKERAHTFGEAREMLRGELSCFFTEPKLDKEKLLAKELPDRPGVAILALKGLLEPLKALPDGVSSAAVKEAIMPLADEEEARGKGGRGAVLWPLRYALSGQERSPDPFTLISILGKEETISRMQKAIAILGE